MTNVLEALSERMPLVITTIVVSVLAFVAQRLLASNSLEKIPWLGLEIGDHEKRLNAYVAGAKPFYKNGYEKFKKGVYQLSTGRMGPTVVVSPIFLEELKRLPDGVLNMKAAVVESLEGKYTGLDTTDDIVAHTVRVNLTPALVRLNPAIAEEVARTLRSEIPECKDWTPVHINGKLLRIVAIVSGRVFIGPELCHDEAYIDAAINYTLDVMNARRAVRTVTPWLRRFKAPFLPEVRGIAEREKKVKDFLSPIVAARRKAEKEEAGYEKPDDMLQWLMDTEKYGEKSDAEIARLQMMLGFAAIHTTTLTATNVFYNLAVHPELVNELREEARTVLAQHNNQFTSLAMQNLRKLDSVLKETMRVHPASFSSFQRKVLKPITLSNGTVLPPGVTIEVPAYGISRDAENFPDPDKFDGLRFYRLREQSGAKEEAAAQNQFVSISPSSLGFGYGRHACPGRFFAANEIKMIVATAVLMWDVRNAGGEGKRYPNWEIDVSSIPDPMRMLEFKEV